ncbi:hypothetical protein GUJ93_ZPchr0013g34282 [Zizania palustris]|uniref:Uncharacterized protein n=1 Tax=Zizania palustris TaxID=103762 RepID=A0A8J5WWK2_ZIZPA|nr:hypothetical protein GUJ93_ZPchr0013g34282 [Zizania palustris]
MPRKGRSLRMYSRSVSGVGHACASEDVHGGAECTDCREDEVVSGEDVLRAAHVADAEAKVADGVANAAHVSRAIVEQRHRCVGRPAKRSKRNREPSVFDLENLEVPRFQTRQQVKTQRMEQQIAELVNAMQTIQD